MSFSFFFRYFLNQLYKTGGFCDKASHCAVCLVACVCLRACMCVRVCVRHDSLPVEGAITSFLEHHIKSFFLSVCDLRFQYGECVFESV